MGSFVTYVPQDDRRFVILSREAAKNPVDESDNITDFGGKTW